MAQQESHPCPNAVRVTQADADVTGTKVEERPREERSTADALTRRKKTFPCDYGTSTQQRPEALSQAKHPYKQEMVAVEGWQGTHDLKLKRVNCHALPH